MKEEKLNGIMLFIVISQILVVVLGFINKDIYFLLSVFCFFIITLFYILFDILLTKENRNRK